MTGTRLCWTTAALALLAANAPAQEARQAARDAAPTAMAAATLDSLLARARQATAPFASLDAAAAAGYPRTIPNCVEHQPHGAMGMHHINDALMDDRLEVERPEVLVYARAADGAYRLNGIEYLVPYRARSRDAEPPTILGQRLKRADGLQLWYLHVWLFSDNPNGLFADWNPRVKC